MLGGFGLTELLIILLIVLIFFGARRLPDLAGGVGKSIRLFKKGLKEETDEAPKEKEKPDQGA